MYYTNPAERQMLCSFVGMDDGTSSPTNINIFNNVTTVTDADALTIDYAEVWGNSLNSILPSPSQTQSISPSHSQSQHQSSSHHSKAGAIAGGTVGAVALLIAFAALYVLTRRRRARDIGSPVPVVDDSEARTAGSPTSPYHGTAANVGATEFGSTVTNSLARTNSRSSVPMSEWTAPASRMVKSPGPGMLSLQTYAYVISVYWRLMDPSRRRRIEPGNTRTSECFWIRPFAAYAPRAWF